MNFNFGDDAELVLHEFVFTLKTQVHSLGLFVAPSLRLHLKTESVNLRVDLHQICSMRGAVWKEN